MFQLWKKIPQYVISYASSALSGPENQLNKVPNQHVCPGEIQTLFFDFTQQKHFT